MDLKWCGHALAVWMSPRCLSHQVGTIPCVIGRGKGTAKRKIIAIMKTMIRIFVKGTVLWVGGRDEAPQVHRNNRQLNMELLRQGEKILEWSDVKDLNKKWRESSQETRRRKGACISSYWDTFEMHERGKKKNDAAKSQHQSILIWQWKQE